MLNAIRRVAGKCARQMSIFRKKETGPFVTPVTQMKRKIINPVDSFPDKRELLKELKEREEAFDKMETCKEPISLQERLEHYKTDPQGKIISCFSDEKGKPRIFPDINEYKIFKDRKFYTYLNILKIHLTPMQLYVTQECGNERPYTGEYWSQKAPGTYSCIVCMQKIFLSDHRFDFQNGYLNFWAAISRTVLFKENNIKDFVYTQAFIPTALQRKKPVKRVICSNCGAHLGYIFDDGPYPFYRRLTVNCASLSFEERPRNTRPIKILPQQRMYQKEVERVKKERKDADERVKLMISLVKDYI